MSIVNKVKSHMVPEAREIPRRHSAQINGAGFFFGALAAGLQASGSFASWFGAIPTWMVWAGGATICLLSVVAQYWKQRSLGDD